MNSHTKTLVYVLILALVLGVALALFIWYGYLEKQRSEQSFDSVFASYSPQGSGGGERAIVQNGPTNPPSFKQNVSEQFSNLTTPDPIAERVTEAPVGAGADIVGESVRYVDRAKGYIYQTNLTSGKTERISNVLLPGAFTIQFVSADTALVQTIDDNDTIIAHTLTFSKESPARDVTIPLAVRDIVLRKNSTLVYALARTDSGGASLVSFLVPYDATKKPDILWTSSLADWRLREGPGTTLLLQQKPSNGIPGYVYTFDTTTNTLTKVLGDTPGVMVLSAPNGSALITSADGSTLTSYITLQTPNDTRTLSRVTFPEKCIWEGAGESLLCGFPKVLAAQEMPEVWYRGEFICDDVLGRVDLATGAITELETKLTSPVDMTDLKLTENGSTLVFTDKTTGALWTVKNLKLP